MKIQYPKSQESVFHQAAGLDLIAAGGQAVTDAAQTRGWRFTGFDSAKRIFELSDIRNYASQSAEERAQYADYAERQLESMSPENMDIFSAIGLSSRQGMSWGPMMAPWRTEDGIRKAYPEFFAENDDVKILKPEEANEKYGIDGELSWGEPVSNLEAHVLHQRKKQEIKFNYVLDRAYGSEFFKGLGIELGMALLDPAMVPLFFIPPLGASRVITTLGVTSRAGGRAVTGGLAGLYGSAAVEPFIYGAATQEQAHYGLLNSFLNITFGTVAGGGLHTIGGAMVDAVRYIRKGRHQAAFNTAVNQAVNGETVEIRPIAHGTEEPEITVVKSSFDEVEVGAVEPAVVPKADSQAPVKQGVTTEYTPHSNKDESLQLMSNKDVAASLSNAKLKNTLKNSKSFNEAFNQAEKLKLKNKLLFRVKNTNGDFIIIRQGEGQPLRLFESEAEDLLFSQGADKFSKAGEAQHAAMLTYGVDMAKSDLNYSGSVKIQKDSMHHIVDVNNVDFDPKMNQGYAVVAAPHEVAKLFQGDPHIAAFTDFVERGAVSVNQAMGLKDDGSDFLKDPFQDALDEHLLDINLNETETGQLGTQKGGVMIDAATGTKWYVKKPDNLDHAKSEFVASTMYRLFGVDMPQIKLVGNQNGEVVGIASRWEEGAKMVTPENFAKLPEETKNGFLKDLVVDMFMGNWDVVGNAPNFNLILTPSGKLKRIDPGGALMFRAQGELKTFDNTIKEFSSMLDGKISPNLVKMIGPIDKEAFVEISREAVKRINSVNPKIIEDVIDMGGMSPKIEDLTKRFYKERLLALQQTKLPGAPKTGVLEGATFSKEFTRVNWEQDTLAFSSITKSKNALEKINKKLDLKLTGAEKEILGKYTGSKYYIINGILRNPATETANKYLDELIASTKNIVGLTHQTRSNPRGNFKGTSAEYKQAYFEKFLEMFDGIFAKVGTLDKSVSVWRGGTPAAAFNNVKGLSLVDNFDINTAKAMKGGIIQDTGYVSTSLMKVSAGGFHKSDKQIYLKINLKPGQKALFSKSKDMAWKFGTNEGEVILPRDIQFVIKDAYFSPQDKRLIFELDALLPGERPPTLMDTKQGISFAKEHKAQKSNGTSDIMDDDPDLELNPNQTQETLKPNASKDIAKITQDIEELKELINAEIANIDPAYVKSATDEINKINAESADAEAMAKELYDAAKAAAVCVRSAA